MTEETSLKSKTTRYVLDAERACPQCGKAVHAVKASALKTVIVWTSERCEEMSPHHCEFRKCHVISEESARSMIE